jgi:hypothetical protein
MKKLYLLAFTLCFAITAIAQKKPNPKIGKNETEITSFIMSDNTTALGGQLVYRFSLKKVSKSEQGDYTQRIIQTFLLQTKLLVMVPPLQILCNL